MHTLRIMSFNIRGAHHQQDGLNIWEQRALLNIETIRSCDPDLIGFQELQLENLNMYQHHLTEYESLLGLRAADSEPYEYVAIFWKPARLTLLKAGSFWLSEMPQTFAKGWDAACIRVANWAHFRVVESEKELLHYNTHLDHVSERARRGGVQLILQRLTSMPESRLPIVVTGDFNCSPNSFVYRLFQEHGFVDTYLAAGKSDNLNAPTFHDFGCSLVSKEEGKGWEQRIDWILLRDKQELLQVRLSEIVRDAKPPLYPSDHYPVISEILLE
ncbi:endonuclease/exonuclease/phosphatase family protein [Ktedonospora formicarum]|uniref:Endonuclease n=1 Tax=Ktedonospora formicarum TaxID=2778364 RepID=A0A8J3I8P8_9CHLR|nr:endonuclease/exonuclease/phosphatase family protein [Ktedonospora formicarum]GHO49268.1 endonuclease [Ktedonospora formicarum]